MRWLARLSRWRRGPDAVPSPPRRNPVTIGPAGRPPRGWVLYSYLEEPLLWADDSPGFMFHSNLWESREIARIFVEEGFSVDVINWSDDAFVPAREYDVLFDISRNLSRLAPLAPPGALKVLHCTGSDAGYQNVAETRRVEDLRRRRGGDYRVQRAVAAPELQARSLEVADACSLLGNAHTLATYPERFRAKMRSVTVSASDLGANRKRPGSYVPPEREFLWFFGWGAAHKGLDLLLEVFAENPQWTLNVVGNALDESEFVRLYKRELTGLPNIRAHRFLQPAGQEFGEILRRCFCVVAPTCSEGISPAVVTCLQAGLFPIISRDTGVSLPPGCGIWLESCSLAEIEAAVGAAHRMPEATLAAQTGAAQGEALRRYSRRAFRDEMSAFLRDAIRTRWDG